MDRLREAFDNWVSVQEQDRRDDDCGETYQEFKNRIDDDRHHFEQYPEDWEDELENYVDISDF